MTEAGLKSQYSDAYCVRATEGGRAWFKLGPDGPITQTVCS